MKTQRRTTGAVMLMGMLCAVPSFPARATEWQHFKQPGNFVMALASDSASNIWVGTEGAGVIRYSPGAAEDKPWKHFGNSDGLGDNYAYGLACDQQGRIWAGHLNHGVSVFDGTKWRNYDVPYGPIGERVFKIAVCPTDGDVWMGTSAGLTRYSVRKDTWTHYTRHDGLPSDQVNAIAFTTNGNIFAGTLADGVAMAGPESDYRKWTTVPVAAEKIPAYAGLGLPSRLVNDLLVASDGKVYVATDGGLAFSGDGGKTWLYRRGRDYPAKLLDLEGGPPQGWKNPPVPDYLLPEDFVTCIAEDAGGVIWLGFREKGLLAMEGFSQRTLLAVAPKEMNKAEFPRAILPMSGAGPWVGSLGGGLLQSGALTQLAGRVTSPVAPSTATANPATSRSSGSKFRSASQQVRMPSPAYTPELPDLNALLAEVAAVPVAPTGDKPLAVAMEDDWRTQGQWLGRHGKFFSVLCAMWSPHDDVWGAGWDADYHAMIGGNHGKNDSIRYWVQWLNTTDNRCLEMSPTYLHSRVVKGFSPWEQDRRESEWDDHGEAYPATKDGPHIYCNLKIPAGLFILSLYDINPNGHDSTRQPRRDYGVSVRENSGQTSREVIFKGQSSAVRSFYEVGEFSKKPELARGRLCDFWGGVYKRFLVHGPAALTVQLNRNHSFNTILAGVMLDLVDELPPPYFQTREAWEQKQRDRKPVTAVEASPPAASEREAAQRIAAAMREMPHRNPTWWAENRRRVHLPLLRWMLDQEQPANAQLPPNATELATSFHELDLYKEWENLLAKQDIVTAREVEKALRWDLVTYDCSRQGNKIVREYIAAHPEKFARVEAEAAPSHPP